MMTDDNRYRRIEGAGVAVVSVAFLVLVASGLAAAGPSLRGLTEAGGGTPAPALPPQPAVADFNPKETAVFRDQPEFLEAMRCRTVSLESFEELPATNRTDTTTIHTADITITTDSPPRLGIWDQRFQGAFATEGDQWMGVEENQLVVPQVTTLTFDAPINHFGVNFTDFGDFGSGNLEFANEVGDMATAAFSGQPSGNQQFFGIINRSRSFRTVTLTHSVAGEFYGVDEIRYCWNAAPDQPANRRSPGRATPD